MQVLKLYKPEWVKWRCHKNESGTKSLVYQLLEGENYLFEGVSADFIQTLLSIDPWTEINLDKTLSGFSEIPKEDVDAFTNELLDNGILTDYVPSYDQIKVMRKQVGDHRIKIEKSRDLLSEKEVKKNLHHIAASYQEAIVDTLLDRIIRISKEL